MTQDIDSVVAVAKREYADASAKLAAAIKTRDEAISNIKDLRKVVARWARIIKADGGTVEEAPETALTGVVTPPPTPPAPAPGDYFPPVDDDAVVSISVTDPVGGTETLQDDDPSKLNVVRMVAAPPEDDETSY